MLHGSTLLVLADVWATVKLDFHHVIFLASDPKAQAITGSLMVFDSEEHAGVTLASFFFLLSNVCQATVKKIVRQCPAWTWLNNRQMQSNFQKSQKCWTMLAPLIEICCRRIPKKNNKKTPYHSGWRERFSDVCLVAFGTNNACFPPFSWVSELGPEGLEVQISRLPKRHCRGPWERPYCSDVF